MHIVVRHNNIITIRARHWIERALKADAPACRDYITAHLTASGSDGLADRISLTLPFKPDNIMIPALLLKSVEPHSLTHTQSLSQHFFQIHVIFYSTSCIFDTESETFV